MLPFAACGIYIKKPKCLSACLYVAQSQNLDLGLGIWDLGFGIEDLGIGDWGLGIAD